MPHTLSMAFAKYISSSLVSLRPRRWSRRLNYMDQSIRIWHDICYEAFGTLLKASSVDDRYGYSEQLSHDALVDLLGRFNVWAGNIGAGQQGRASLDYRLREAGYIKEAVIRTLQHLSEALEDANSIISGRRPPYDEVSSDSESSESSSLGDLNRDESEASRIDNNAADQTLSRTELQQLQHSMSSFIRNLYQISIIVRTNPAPHDRLIKSAKIDTSFYEFFDERHVQEKYPYASQELARRLGDAISKRRKYFKYREQHRQKLSVSQNQGRIRDPMAGIQNHPVMEIQSMSQIADAQKGPADEEETPSLRQPTSTWESTTASTFVAQPSQTPFNLKTIDQQSDTATQTTYESVSSSAPDRLRIPNPPKVSQDAAEFECPYCFTIYRFRARERWKQIKEWKQHVLRDLQPYICTFGGCSQVNTLYERRGEWMRHEVQCHRREWSCNATGHEIYKTRTELKAHMNDQHCGSYSADQLDSIIDILERPATSSRSSCPLCHDERYQELDLDRLERHLGHHLQVLATFALPSVGSESRASDDSIAAQDARYTDEETSQSSRVTEDDFLLPDNKLDDNAGPYDDISKNYDLSSRREDTYFPELSEFQSNVEHQTVPERCGARCLRSWINIDPESPLNLTVRDAAGAKITLEIFPNPGEGECGSAQVRVSDLFEHALDLAVRSLEQGKGLSRSDYDYFFHSVRGRLREFTKLVIAEIVLQKEQDEELLNSLKTLETQLTIPPPYEAPADSDPDSEPDSYQEWGFLNVRQPQTKVVIRANEQGQDDAVEKFCQWLTLVDQSFSPAAVLDWVYPGTCSWLRECGEYKEFRSGRLKVLLVEGLPGCGKTALCSAKIIQELELEDSWDGSLGLAHYFLGQQLNDIAALFRALICQLIRQARSVPPPIRAVFRDSSSSSKSLTMDQLQKILEGLVSFFKKTILVVDALDRIEKHSIQILSRFIRRISNQGVEIQLIATSRISMAVDDAFWDPTFAQDSEERSRWSNSCGTLFISRQFTSRDIEICARSATYRNAILKEAGSAFRQATVRSIIVQSNGIFTFASVQLQRIRSCDSREEILLALSTAPNGIGDLWQEILARVLGQSKAEREMKIVHRILETLSVSERHLNAEEIDGNLGCGLIITNDKLDVWRQCPALCELASQPLNTGNETFGLIHDSLKELLQSNEFHDHSLGALAVDASQAQHNILSRCLVELLKYRSPDSYTSKYGWTAYAGTYWHVHAKKICHDKPTSHNLIIWRDCTQLLRSETASFSHWTYMTGWRGDLDKDEHGDFGKKETYPSPLYYAALLGLLPSAEQLIEEGEDVNVKGGKHRFPVLAAIENGEIELVRLLLERGADPNSRYKDGDTALIKAIKRDHKELFKALLVAGVDVEIRDKKRHMTAAHWAVLYRRPEFLEALLIAGANRDPCDEFDMTPLHLAIKYDNVANTKLLLSAGAILDARDKEGLRPLHIAARGAQHTLGVLLEHGAKVNARDYDGRTPLVVAAGKVNVTIVQQLLDEGADPNKRNRNMQTPLHKAAAPWDDMENTPSGISKEEVYEVKREIVRLLLEHGADPSMRDISHNLSEDVADDPVIKRILQDGRFWRQEVPRNPSLYNTGEFSD
ncbi:MAG: hypothetical protein Q9225_007585 [Loekoesia sp. 1 TL-2023]